MQFDDKNSALNWLFSKRADSARTSLAPLLKASDELGNPHLKLRCIQIAGTNGKGSVCHKLAHTFHSAGRCAGLFTSPHLDDFNERICVDLKPIESEEVVGKINELIEVLSEESLRALGFFDFTLLLALVYFQKKGIDLAILEVGIGGRLDATSICSPQITAITSIGFDHEQMLGSTKHLIAAEKGGIIRPHTPLVLGPEAQQVGLEEMARDKGAPLYAVPGVDLPFDEINRYVASKVLDLLAESFHFSESAVHKGLSYRPSCRFEVIYHHSEQSAEPLSLIFDVAHNESAFDKLVKMLLSRGFTRPLHVLFGLSRSKALSPCLQVLKRLSPERLFPYQLENISSYNHLEIASIAERCEILCSYRDLKTGVLASSLSGAKTLLICGSFHLAAAMRRELKALKSR